MPGRINCLEATRSIEDLFRSGVPSISLIGLSRDDATSWKDTLELEGYSVIMSEPSKLDNTPELNLLYSVIITNRKK